MTTIRNGMNAKETEPSGKASLHVSISCGSLVLLMPCTVVTEADLLFERCGYREDEHLNTFLGLGVEIDTISADFSNKCEEEEAKAVTKINYAVLFANSTKLESSRRGRRRFASSYVPRRVDLMACAADQDRASDSFIMLSYTRPSHTRNQSKCRKKSNFPMILPLSSMKARQEDDDSDVEYDGFDDMFQSPGSKMESNTFKPSDPQFIMSAEASEATH
jgi:hypothetical protein